MGSQEKIAAFFSWGPHAVVGASQDRDKYGNKVLRCYMQHQRRVFPVNPHAAQIEGLTAYAALDALPEPVHGLSITTPSYISETIVAQAVALGIGHVWMQPGAESPNATQRAEMAGLSVIADGSCILVVMGYSE